MVTIYDYKYTTYQMDISIYNIWIYIMYIQNIYDDELNNCCHDTTLKWAADHDTAGRVTNAMSSVP